MRERFVLLVVILIGTLDFATGVYLLTAPTPWLAHGPETVWSLAAPGAPGELTMSLFRRVGAFSLYAGSVTLVWAWLGKSDRKLLSALLITYSVVGIAFAYADNAYFAGTAYLRVKQAIGGFWTAALIAHFWPRVINPDRSAPETLERRESSRRS